METAGLLGSRVLLVQPASVAPLLERPAEGSSLPSNAPKNNGMADLEVVTRLPASLEQTSPHLGTSCICSFLHCINKILPHHYLSLASFDVPSSSYSPTLNIWIMRIASKNLEIMLSLRRKANDEKICCYL